MTLLETGIVTVKDTEYTAVKSDLKFARSAISGVRTCFNAVFMISLPNEVKWVETEVRTLSASSGSLNISTDTILSGATRAAEMSVSATGGNMKKKESDTPPDQPNQPTPNPAPGTPAPNPPPGTSTP